MIKKIFKLLFFFIFIYFIIAFSVYLISAIALSRGKIIDIHPIINYQNNAYGSLGFMNVWQAQNECVEFDKDTIYVPKIGKCVFNNIEFKTELNFTAEGRDNNNKNLILKNKKGIAVIGDSFAMGWGVNDNETFSSVLEKNLGIRVYNLAVAGYATERSLIRLKKSNLIDSVETIIIVYCYNDYGENEAHLSLKDEDNSKKKYEIISTAKLSILKRLRKAIRYSVKIPMEILFGIKEQNNWESHVYFFEEILKKYDFVTDKKIIVIGVNGPEKNFLNFPNGNSNNIPNLTYVDIKFEKEDFFIIDGHLNPAGHKKISQVLSKYVN